MKRSSLFAFFTATLLAWNVTASAQYNDFFTAQEILKIIDNCHSPVFFQNLCQRYGMKMLLNYKYNQETYVGQIDSFYDFAGGTNCYVYKNPYNGTCTLAASGAGAYGVFFHTDFSYPNCCFDYEGQAYFAFESANARKRVIMQFEQLGINEYDEDYYCHNNYHITSYRYFYIYENNGLYWLSVETERW